MLQMDLKALPLVVAFAIIIGSPVTADAQSRLIDGDRPGDRMIAGYFAEQTKRLADNCLAEIESLDVWLESREGLRGELLDMLGLHPLPERTDLNATVTSSTDMGDWVVENLHFQSRPGLYVTANLYRPKEVAEPLPAILYVCGHGGVKKDGVSFGNKAHYHHHGAWFARNGYVCLTIDSLQLGEIEAIHHGTYRYEMWWWLNRGYTPAGVEAWNCVRALDYLESRPDVDADRFGVTGRSGGGAYSWWIAAIDERIKCAVPVAGITDLTNYVVDGCVEGHCDCMFFVNTYQWDYPLVAALVAPRPLLISNTDRDSIFPLDGVVRTHEKARRIYDLYGAEDQLALHITAGPHKDTQELRVHAFRWFNQHLKNDDSLVTDIADKRLEPEQLQVFQAKESEQRLPSDNINADVHESFVPRSEGVTIPSDKSSWETQRRLNMDHLDNQVFRGWPGTDGGDDIESRIAFDVTRDGIRFRGIDFESQTGIDLRLYLATRAEKVSPDLVVLNALDHETWADFVSTMSPTFPDVFPLQDGIAPNQLQYDGLSSMLKQFPWGMAYVAPRGIGRSEWDDRPKKRVQIRRRFYLLGQSLDGMRVFDFIQSVRALRQVPGIGESQLWLQGQGPTGAMLMYASLYIDDVSRMDLHKLPNDHRDGPYLLNITKNIDMPTAIAMACDRTRVIIYSDSPESWSRTRELLDGAEIDTNQLQIRESLDSESE